MKRRNIEEFFNLERVMLTPSFIFLLTILICSCIFGAFVGVRLNDTSIIRSLSDIYIHTSININADSILTALYPLSIDMLYICIIFLCGLFKITAFLIPCLLVYKGFSSALAISALLMSMDSSAIMVSIAAVGIDSIIFLPCFLILCTIILEIVADIGYVRGGWAIVYIKRIFLYRKLIVMCVVLFAILAIINICIPYLLVYI